MESLNRDKSTILMYALLILVRGVLSAQSSSLSMWYSRRCYERCKGELIMTIYDKVVSRKMIIGIEKQEPAKTVKSTAPEGSHSNGQSNLKPIDGVTEQLSNGTKQDATMSGPHSKEPNTGSLATKFKVFKDLLWASHAVTSKSTERANNGQVLNMIRSDADDVAKRFMEIPRMIQTPLGSIFSIYLIWRLLGWSSLLAVALILIAQSCNLLITRLQIRWQRYRKKATDERVEMNSQFIQVIRHLRWYGWEKQWLAKVMASRRHELNIRIVSIALQILSYNITVTAGMFLPAVTFLVFTTFSGQQLRIDLIFPALQLLTNLRIWLRDVLTLTRALINAHVAMGRIEDFMNEPEKEPDKIREGIDSTEIDMSAITFDSCSLAWPGTIEPVLNSVTLKLEPGLTLIYGPIGGGKTALLQAVLGEMEVLNGRSNIPNQSVGYCSQKPWLQSISIRDNILFFSPHEEERYQKVLEACALQPDLASFEDGDLSQIGEK
jgi:ABC-type multidrug transport system fused ATPase/permease subunit